MGNKTIVSRCCLDVDASNAVNSKSTPYNTIELTLFLFFFFIVCRDKVAHVEKQVIKTKQQRQKSMVAASLLEGVSMRSSQLLDHLQLHPVSLDRQPSRKRRKSIFVYLFICRFEELFLCIFYFV